MIYDLGAGIELRYKAYTPDRVLTSATVALTLTKPDGSTVAPAITETATGIYDAAEVTADQAGRWSFRWDVTGAVVDVVNGAFSVADPAPQIYADLSTVKAALGKTIDNDRDDLILQAISAASRQIDRRCGRYFYADATATTRTFRALAATIYVGFDQVLMIDDIADSTGVTVAVGTTGSYSPLTGFDLGPFNAQARGLPYTEIRARYGWLPSYVLVQVTAKWGWPAVPDDIVQATALLAARLYRRKDSPQGVLSSSEWGAVRVSRVDPDVEALISPFVIPVIA